MAVIPLRKDVRMQCGSKYELVSVKVGENTVRGGVGRFDSPKLAKLMYMKTEGPGIQSMVFIRFPPPSWRLFTTVAEKSNE